MRRERAGRSTGGSSYVEGGHRMRLYNISLYVAICAMFGGVGSIGPQNYAEYGAISILITIGSFVWAYVIGSLCSILANRNPQEFKPRSRFFL